MSISGPIGLSLSGGGSKGAWTAGVIQYLWEVLQLHDIRIMYGTSTGALISALMGAAVSTGDQRYIYDMLQVYGSVKTGDILRAKSFTDPFLGLGAALLAKSESVYGTEPLEKLINEYIPSTAWNRMSRAGKRKNKPIDIGFTAVDLSTGESKTFSNRHYGSATLKKAVLASSNQPVFMPPVSIDDNRYVDGGLRDFNPIEDVLGSPQSSDVTALLVVSTRSVNQTPDTRAFDKVGTIFERTLDILTHAVFVRDATMADIAAMLRSLRSQYPDVWGTIKHKLPKELAEMVNGPPVPIIRIEPLKPLDGDPLSFEPKLMKKWIRQGFHDAKKILANYNSPIEA